MIIDEGFDSIESLLLTKCGLTALPIRPGFIRGREDRACERIDESSRAVHGGRYRLGIASLDSAERGIDPAYRFRIEVGQQQIDLLL